MNMGQLEHFLNQNNIYFLSIVLPLVLVLTGMTLAVISDAYIGRRHKIILYHVIVLSFILIIQNNISDYSFLWKQGPSIAFRTASSVLGYSIRPMFLVLFLGIVDTDRKYIPEWFLVIANCLVYLTAFISPITFGYKEGGVWVPGPLRNTCLFVSLFFLLELIYITARKYRGIRKREMIIPVFCILIIVFSLVLDYNTKDKIQAVTFLTIAIVISGMLYYIWLHLQFVRNHEEDLKARQRIQIMISQIQPHFLFNTLSVAQALCDSNPQTAKRTLGKLGLYLRQNLDSLNHAELIPFEKELEHTRLYADIEMERFEDISVEYDIQDLNFLIPALTVQPLVENAIRHGIRGVDNGKVRVSTGKKENWHEIVVSDNGTGFDIEDLSSQDGTHIGIKNVEERIEKLCRGRLEIDSRLGEGTRVVIRIPLNSGYGADDTKEN